MSRDSAHEFERVAAEQKDLLITEFLDFLVQNKKWWLLPILLCMLLIGLLIFFSGTAAAPFIYTLF